MDVKVFIQNLKEAFGEKILLPIVFWYSDTPAGDNSQINGCMFKFLPKVHEGTIVSLSAENTTCGGGKFYCGFTPMPERVPGFVSLTEKYKRTPDDVLAFLEQLGAPLNEKQWLNFARIDKIESFENIEGVTFFAEPDVLSGLTTWAYFDNNDEGAVSSIFGSGCSAIVTQAVVENRRAGRRTFLGGFDPSVRPYFERNQLSFTIPMCRLSEMYETMRQSCLFDTHAWKKVRGRIDS